MPKYIKKPLKITVIIGLKSKKKVTDNKARFKRKSTLGGGIYHIIIVAKCDIRIKIEYNIVFRKILNLEFFRS